VNATRESWVPEFASARGSFENCAGVRTAVPEFGQSGALGVVAEDCFLVDQKEEISRGVELRLPGEMAAVSSKDGGPNKRFVLMSRMQASSTGYLNSPGFDDLASVVASNWEPEFARARGLGWFWLRRWFLSRRLCWLGFLNCVPEFGNQSGFGFGFGARASRPAAVDRIYAVLPLAAANIMS
jgi:hypothetical protein